MNNPFKEENDVLKCEINLRGVHKLRLQDLSFFDHLPPSVYIFYGIKVYKKLIFLTTYPPPLVNVVCERPPVFDIKKLTLPVLTQLELDTKCHFGSDQLQFQGMKSFFIDQVSLKHTS